MADPVGVDALRAALAVLGNAMGPAEGPGPVDSPSGVDWDALLSAADEVHTLAGPVLDAYEATRQRLADAEAEMVRVKGQALDDVGRARVGRHVAERRLADTTTARPATVADAVDPAAWDVAIWGSRKSGRSTYAVGSVSVNDRVRIVRAVLAALAAVAPAPEADRG